MERMLDILNDIFQMQSPFGQPTGRRKSACQRIIEKLCM